MDANWRFDNFMQMLHRYRHHGGSIDFLRAHLVLIRDEHFDRSQNIELIAELIIVLDRLCSSFWPEIAVRFILNRVGAAGLDRLLKGTRWVSYYDNNTQTIEVINEVVYGPEDEYISLFPPDLMAKMRFFEKRDLC